jgi:5-methylcytosine-specific restriction protein A
VAIGWTQFEEEYGAHGGVDKITKSVQYLRRKLRSTSGFQIGRPNLSAQHSLGRGYEAGTVCFKVYPSSALPEEAVLIDDLRNALGLYRELKGLTGANILNLDVPETPLADPEAAVEELHRASANVRTPEEAQALINSYTEHVSSLPADVKRRIGQAFKRDQKLSRLVKEAAGYRCQICRESGFSQPSGTPYAEAHHTLELSHGGLDLPANMVCVCPTCHAIIHHGTQEGLNQRKHSA